VEAYDAAMKTHHVVLLATAAWLSLGCTRQEAQREIDWAKAALARNPDFEIVATDESAGVFTVRDTVTGTIRTLRLQDLIASPLDMKDSTRPAPESAPAPAASTPPEAPESPPEQTAEPALADDQTTAPEAMEPVRQGGGSPLVEGPGYRISRGTGDRPEVAPSTALEGPGYSITREASARPAGSATPEAPPANASPRSDPIICQGNRLMRIDGETLSFTGDAVIAEKGCDLYISNARIRAGGVGIIARQQARVHIVNSTIGGIRGSYEASDGAQIYVARSTFEGVGRRFDGGSMTDLGGNSYATR
jgi:hypothetical protein